MALLPPHDDKSEMCVIGCCLLSPKECLPQCQSIIKGIEYFYTVRCQEAWLAMSVRELDKIDVIVLSQAGGLPYQFLIECQELVHSVANLPAWLEVVVEKYLLRRLVASCSKIVADAYESKEPMRLLDDAEREILAIRPSAPQQAQDIKSLTSDALVKIERLFTSKGSISGLSTGLVDLDRLTDGLHGGEMVVIAAYPSTGKTTLSVNMVFENALKGIPSAVFTAEMRPVQLVIKAICAEARINLYDVRDGHVSESDFGRMTAASARIAASKIHIESIAGQTIGQLIALARRVKQKHDIKLAVVDYLQLLSCPGMDNREQEVSQISKGIKAIAMELDIPVIVLSQLNDDGKLRESRAIGQDADGIWKLSLSGDRVPDVQPIKLVVEKNREGATGSVDLTFLKKIQRFESVSKIGDDSIPKSNGFQHIKLKSMEDIDDR